MVSTKKSIALFGRRFFISLSTNANFVIIELKLNNMSDDKKQLRKTISYLNQKHLKLVKQKHLKKIKNA
ncbi:hypothetical protein DA099_07800 [Photobacterium damselae]|uniref:Uncharacterized protein n=1 Tax=Photobacterium damselae TaxID=38293 RepID=A0ACD3T441_PHODM|nr:hypothetical protein BC461_13310 [Photobacterium damselae]TMX52642.1 hypothetical protein DA099_07800 [Photobacterium damselae]TMX69852.1 hypothetical protein DA090_03195 [Photobacterium damselae]TMX77709.1 hypothetical protein DA092_03825 [Photobacterium damselae]